CWNLFYSSSQWSIPPEFEVGGFALLNNIEIRLCRILNFIRLQVYQ
ncbi:MAG: hypothetical protein ACI86C_001300, partial [Candidatus Latescibacterota bacterium]